MAPSLVAAVWNPICTSSFDLMMSLNFWIFCSLKPFTSARRRIELCAIWKEEEERKRELRLTLFLHLYIIDIKYFEMPLTVREGAIWFQQSAF
jgi:hypothetical protein